MSELLIKADALDEQAVKLEQAAAMAPEKRQQMATVAAILRQEARQFRMDARLPQAAPDIHSVPDLPASVTDAGYGWLQLSAGGIPPEDAAWVLREVAQAIVSEPPENGWISVQNFRDSGYTGWCWISYKGRVTAAYHDHLGVFRFHRWSDNVYMAECIRLVMPWHPPAVPGEVTAP